MNASEAISPAEQGSPEWLLEKCGYASASSFSDILAKGEGKSRSTYLRRIVVERLTGKPTETYSNQHMARGKEQEVFARAGYEMRNGVMVHEVGFIKHDDPTFLAGCSPDGLVGENGGTEIKSVIPTVQYETILAGGYPSAHKAQIQGNLWILKREWWDFVSYSPDMPGRSRLYVFHVERDEAYIDRLRNEVGAFLDQAAKVVEEFKNHI